MRATLFKNMQSNADLTISSGTYDTAVSAKDSTQNVKVLTAAETGALIDVLVSLFDENEKVTEVSFDGLSIGALNDNSEAICNSLVIHGTVSNKLLTNSSVVVVDDEIEVTDINLINDTELKAFLSDLNKIFGEALINNLATSISGGDTVDKAISEYSDTDKYTSEIFRATTSRFIINTPSFSAFEIERDDLGTETKTVTINNLDRYADNKADIITQDEFDHLFEAMKAIKENTGNQEASITSLFEPGSATKLSFNTLAASSDELVESYILRKEFSKQIKDELNSATLDFLDGLYLGTEATGKLYVSKSEMKNILNAVTVLNVDNISNINLDINSDSSFIYSLNETNIKALCNSTLISFNIRKSLVSANTGGGYFNNILALTQGIAKEDVDSLDVLTGSEYVYSTTNVDNDHPSEVCSLLVSVVSLKNNGYLSIITNPAGATLGTFKDEAFVVTVTDDSILRDSIPGIITNLGSKSTNPTFNLSSLEVPARAYSAPGRIKKDYMKGVNLYTDGELYRFIDAIEASNQLMSEATRERVLTMLRSDIAFDTIDAALVTIDSTIGAFLPKRISTVENADITIGDGTAVNRRDYDSTNGHAFIDGILTYL